MNLSQRIWHIASIVTVLVLIVSFRLVYWQLIRGEELQPVAINPIAASLNYRGEVKELDIETLINLEELPQPVVQRTAELLSHITRGVIYDRNGRPLAYDLDKTADAPRFYTEPSLAHIVGYVSGLRVGLAGIEYSYNESLLGLDRLDSQFRQLLHEDIVGSNMQLTIDSHLQRTAATALGNRAGAIVAMDGRTGAILAMVSQPAYDPNQVLNPDYAAGLLAGCESQNCQSAFFNRATLGLYTPGSTWKTATLIAALDTGQVSRDTVFDFGEPRPGPNGPVYIYVVNGFPIEDPNHSERQLNLTRSYAVSANAAFARMAHEMPGDVLLNYAQRLGFSRDDGAPPIEIAASPAQLANNPADIVSNEVLRASTGFGQGELLASPLSMALVVAAVTNDGNIPTPHLVQAVTDPFGNVMAQAPTEPWITGVMRPETAQLVREMMVEVVRSGSGVFAAVPGLTVGGKTGTAEVGPGAPPHAWFIGFAADPNRTVVIAVLVENGGQGADVAAPIFAQVANAALRELGQPVEEIVPPPPANP